MKESQRLSFDFYLLMPYYNNLPGLISSLKSVSYDPSAYAILIVDDGSGEALRSADLSPFLPASLSVTILRQASNQGITKALNTGMRWLSAHGNCRYVARLDCGDLCDETRFRRQVGFLDEHTDIDLVGSWCIFRNFVTGASYRYMTPTEYKKILKGMHFRNIFIHPTVMWRNSEIARKTGAFYPENFPHAEDYGFFYEIISRGEAAVIPEYLVICEINPKGLSLFFRKEQLKSRMRVVRQYGKNRVFSLMGILKLWVLLAIPYKFVLQTKKIVYGIKHNDVI